MKAPCAKCGEDRYIAARKLCTRCYQQVRNEGLLDAYPAANRTPIPLIEGCTYRQMDFWCRKGYLHPEGCTGSGVWRKWPDEEVRVARVMARLAAVGIPPAVAVRVAREGGDLGGGVSVVLAEIGQADAGS